MLRHLLPLAGPIPFEVGPHALIEHPVQAGLHEALAARCLALDQERRHASVNVDGHDVVAAVHAGVDVLLAAKGLGHDSLPFTCAKSCPISACTTSISVASADT